jgi:hypothetical protein
MSAVLIALLLLAAAILVGNTLIAIGFLRSRRNHFTTTRGGDAAAIDELHRRVKELSGSRK